MLGVYKTLSWFVSGTLLGVALWALYSGYGLTVAACYVVGSVAHQWAVQVGLQVRDECMADAIALGRARPWPQVRPLYVRGLVWGYLAPNLALVSPCVCLCIKPLALTGDALYLVLWPLVAAWAALLVHYVHWQRAFLEVVR